MELPGKTVDYLTKTIAMISVQSYCVETHILTWKCISKCIFEAVVYYTI